MNTKKALRTGIVIVAILMIARSLTSLTSLEESMGVAWIVGFPLSFMLLYALVKQNTWLLTLAVVLVAIGLIWLTQVFHPVDLVSSLAWGLALSLSWMTGVGGAWLLVGQIWPFRPLGETNETPAQKEVPHG